MSTADIESASLSEEVSGHQHDHYASSGADTKSLHPVRPKKR